MTPKQSQTDQDRNERFARLSAEHQQRIYLYILALLPNRADAADVLQETSVVLWRKIDQFAPGTNFRAWACRIAHFEVLKFRKRRGQAVAYLDDELLEEVASLAFERMDDLDARKQALAYCLAKLHRQDRDLIRRRYDSDSTIKAMARQIGRPAGSIYNSLSRIHRALFECIDRALAREATR